MSDDSDLEISELVKSGKDHVQNTIRQLRLQYENSLQKQHELELKILKLQSSRKQPILVSKYIQSNNDEACLESRSSQTDKYCPDADDRFFNKVDDVVKQNNELQSNIYLLQEKIEEMDSSQNSLYSDFNLKHAAVVEQLKISQEKREKSYLDRINFLEEDRTASLMNSYDSASISSTKSDGYPGRVNGGNVNIAQLADLQREEQIRKSGDTIMKHIQKALEIARTSKTTTANQEQELNKIKFEKDTALKKCLKLDKQLSAVKGSKEHLEGEVRKLEEELQSLRLFYNLHQSLSQEADLRDQYDTQVHELTERLKHRETELLASQRENDTLASMIKRLERRLAQTPVSNGIMTHRSTNKSSSRSPNTQNYSSSSTSVTSML